MQAALLQTWLPPRRINSGWRLPTSGRDRALFRPVRCGPVFTKASRTQGFTEPLKGLGPSGDMG